MAQQLVGKIVSQEAAKGFAKCLGLFGNDLERLAEMSLSRIIEIWVKKDPNQCTPEVLVEALVCTKGLGMYASKLACELHTTMLRCTSVVVSISYVGLHVYVAGVCS